MASEKIKEVCSLWNFFNFMIESLRMHILQLLDKILLELNEFIDELTRELDLESTRNASVEELHDLIRAIEISEETSTELQQNSEETGNQEVTDEELQERTK